MSGPEYFSFLTEVNVEPSCVEDCEDLQQVGLALAQEVVKDCVETGQRPSSGTINIGCAGATLCQEGRVCNAVLTGKLFDEKGQEMAQFGLSQSEAGTNI